MNATNPQRPERRLSLDPREDRLLALSLAYLNEGLSPEKAFDSASIDLAAAFAERPCASTADEQRE